MHIKRPMCALCILLLAVTIVYAASHPVKITDDIENSDGRTMCITGRVQDKRIKNNNMYIFANEIKTDEELPKLEGLVIYVSDYEDIDKDLKIGAYIKVKGIYKPYDAAMNEGSFDARKYYKIRGYDGQLKRARVLGISRKYNIMRQALFEVRNKCKEIIFSELNEEDAGILSAMLLGDKSELDDDIKELYQLAGISHILALSGLHIAAIGLFMLKTLRKLGIGKNTASIISSVIVLLYSVMTGMSVSTKRAIIMFIVAVGAVCIGRTYDLLSAAALAAIIVFVTKPQYIYDSGSLLSFGAIVGIGCVYPALYKLIKESWIAIRIAKLCKLTRIPKFVYSLFDKMVEGLILSISITVTTLPVMAYSFFQISVYSFIINLIVIPLMGIVLATGFTGIAFGMTGGRLMGFMCEVTFKISSVILNAYKKICGISTRSHTNIFLLGRPGILVGILYYILLVIIVMIYISKKPEHSISASRIYIEVNKKQTLKSSIRHFVLDCVYIMLLTMLPIMLCIHKKEELEIRNIYVGQGDSCLVYGKNVPVLMIDGGSSDIENVGKYNIVPVLKSNRISQIDYCFVTHMDKDHANGIEQILNNPQWGITIRNIVVSEAYESSEGDMRNKEFDEAVNIAVREKRCRKMTVKSGDTFVLNNLIVDCLAPGIREEYTGNDSSLVLVMSLLDQECHKLISGNECADYKYIADHILFRGVFTGDMSAAKERQLISRFTDSTYLKVGHHGSRYSTSEELLNVIKPKMAVISAGVNNSYGHPHMETLERLSRRIPAILVFRTDINGQITVKVDDRKVTVNKYR